MHHQLNASSFLWHHGAYRLHYSNHMASCSAITNVLLNRFADITSADNLCSIRYHGDLAR